MKAKILYDGHSKGWAIELECETESEGALLFELTRFQEDIKIEPRSMDLHNPEHVRAGMRVFRIERKEWTKRLMVAELDRPGHYA